MAMTLTRRFIDSMLLNTLVPNTIYFLRGINPLPIQNSQIDNSYPI